MLSVPSADETEVEPEEDLEALVWGPFLEGEVDRDAAESNQAVYC